MSRSKLDQDTPAEPAAQLSDHIEQNIENMVALRRRDWDHTHVSRRRVERVSRLLGRPVYLVGILVFVIVWIAFNLTAPARVGRHSIHRRFPFCRGP
jgi:uncharacterized membrane protein